MMKDELQKKQQELKSWLKKLGITQIEFAKRAFYYINEEDDPDEMNKHIERFKKAINRDSTDIKLIDSYLEILFEQNEFLKLGLIKPEFHYGDDFNPDFNKKMKNISQKISEKLIYPDADE